LIFSKKSQIFDRNGQKGEKKALIPDIYDLRIAIYDFFYPR